MQTVILSHFIFLTLSRKNVKNLEQNQRRTLQHSEKIVKRRVSVLSRLLPGKCFLHFFSLNCRRILQTLTPHNKKQIINLVWNENVSQVEWSHKTLWNKFYLLKLWSENISFSTISINSTKLIIPRFTFLCAFGWQFWLVLFFIWFDRLKQHSREVKFSFNGNVDYCNEISYFLRKKNIFWRAPTQEHIVECSWFSVDE